MKIISNVFSTRKLHPKYQRGASLKDKDNDPKFQFNYTKSNINDYVGENTLWERKGGGAPT
jgi:hypothetical protein